VSFTPLSKLCIIESIWCMNINTGTWPLQKS
jgi:hypothetical protein